MVVTQLVNEVTRLDDKVFQGTITWQLECGKCLDQPHWL